MKVAFTKFNAIPGVCPETWRPMLKAKLFGNKRTLKFDMLVDSGADETVFSKAWLDQVGVIYTGDTVRLRGVGDTTGPGQLCHIGRVRMEVAGHTFDARVCGIEGDLRTALLGQRNFFEKFHVQFEGNTKTFYVNPYRSHLN